MRLNQYRKKSIGTLVVLLFVLSFTFTPALLFSNYNFGSGFKNPIDEEQNLNLSTNYLFAGTTYTFNLDDFYDDANLYKVYTGAKFQTEAFNGTSLEWSGVVNNDTVTPVDNDETQYGDPININMIEGSHDYTDNMKVNDDSSTNFTSTHTDGYIYEMPDQWDDFTFTEGSGDTIGEIETIASNEFIYDITYTWATDGGGTLENTHTDDTDYKQVNAKFVVAWWIEITLNFDPALAGRDFYISAHITSSANSGDLKINGVVWKSGVDINFDNELKTGVTSISYETAKGGEHNSKIYYFKLIEVNHSIIGHSGSSGYYPATYSFEEDDIGVPPVEWIDDSGTGCWADVISQYNGHNKVCELVDAGTGRAILYQTIDSQTINTIEFWWQTDVMDSGKDANFRLMQNSVYDGILFLFGNNYFQYYDTSMHIIVSASVNTWYHIKIEFNTNSDKWWVWINDVKYGGVLGYNYRGSTTEMKNIQFDTWTGTGQCLYIDAVGYSWDVNYTIGDNRYPYIDLDVQVDIQVDDPDCSSIEFLKYTHKTNVSATIDLDIWNWDTSVWFEIESVDNFASFDDDSFTLGSGSDYVNASFGVRIRFQLNTGSNNFQLQIDRLRLDYLTIPAELEMTITFLFANYNEDLLAMNVQSWQRTNISQTINFSIWNFDTESYVQISSSSDTTFTKKEYNTTSPANFISPTGVVKLNWTRLNATDDFELHIDYLFIQIFYKLNLEHSKSFDTSGNYRYRWAVLGSIQYTQWVVFEVVDPVPNFHAISESDNPTRWLLQGADISPVENFTDDISGSNWDLYGVSERTIHINEKPTDDSYGGSTNPDTNYGSHTRMNVYYAPAGPAWANIFLKYEYPYFDTNYTSNSTLYFYGSINQDSYVYTYHTSDFNEGTITWNNQPATGTYQVGWGSSTGAQEEDIGAPNYYYKLVSKDDMLRNLEMCTTEEAYSYKQPYLRHHLSKNYQGGGYMYMQTNTTELISLRSTAYGTNYTLSSGDYFEVDFQTSSDSQINIILLRDGVVNKTLTLSQSGNTNFNRHTVQIPVDETVEFDQLRISSTFEDTDYVRIYDIKTYKYTLTGDSADFYVGSHQNYETYLTPDIYNLRIRDPHDGEVKVNTNITISSGYNSYLYEPIETIQCRLVLFSEADPLKSLPFTDYHITVNRSLNGEYDQFSLLENIFYADDNNSINVYIDVYDRFDSLIGSFERLASSYIDLEIEVYSLEIINLMLQKTTIDINSTHIFEIASGRWITFMLSKQYYQIGYYNPNNVYTQFIIYLDSNQVYELNMSRICNLYYTNQRMEPLSFYQFKTYINGTRIINNMFYATDGEHKGIEVKDLSDISVLNDTYIEGTEELNQISLILTQYSLKVMSLQLCFNHINITRDPNYYESSYYWSEWLAPRETAEYFLFAGYYVINITNSEDGGWSKYDYTLNGSDYILIGSNNTIYNVLINIANVNATIGNQITNVLIDITNQNSYINNSVINIEINLGNINSTLGNMLTNIDVNILNLESDIASLYTFTNTSIWNLNTAMNNSFIYLENNIYSINQSISTLVIGIDNSISLLNASIDLMFTEMNNQFIVVQSTLNYSFAFLNQSVIQLANDIVDNRVILYNLIEQRANDIDSSLIDVQTLINLVNNTVADESLVIQTLVNLIGANITSNHIIINNLLNLIDNNITNNNIQLVSILDIIGNNITTNHFVIQTLLDVIGNNITYNHIELLTNLNLINTTISQNQIELINRLLFINNTMNDVLFELTNQLLFLNGTIYSAVLNLSTSVEFGVDMVIGNITLTYQQNEFLTELYKQTMFSQLISWDGAAYNYTLMEDRIDVWEFINNYRNDSIQVLLRYNDLIDNLTVSAQNTIEQYLPNEDVEYRLWSVAKGEYLSEWEPLPDNKTVSFGFYDEEVPEIPSFDNTSITIVLIILIFIGVIGFTTYLIYKYNNRFKRLKRAYAMQHTIDKDLIEGAVRPRSSRMNKIK